VFLLKYEAYLTGYEYLVIVRVASNGALMTELGCEFSVIVCSLGQEACPCRLRYESLIIV
jgi:hypothetical protein